MIIVLGKASNPGGKPVAKLLSIDNQFYYSYFRIHLIASTLKEIGDLEYLFPEEWVGYPHHFFNNFRIYNREWYIKNR